ncbi:MULTISPECIES: hypothetical protein [Pseudomonas]|uniref:DUF3102 domain-containing protein n=2 Tax=Pseudomonas TaxID=286 RepID=A0A1Q9R8S4_PSEPU|nr:MULTISPECIES: hypothetical protein [Pseudomonas]NNJ15477.1 hypothetical protein [Pseudomonas bharatica CSV86]OLS63768.1 hypothetical protein PSEMO_13350 [Pseudomonas putida]
MARSKAKPAEQEQLPALNGEVLTATQNAMAATLASHSDERDLLNQLLGQAQMAGAFEEFSRTVRTSKLAYVKENKLYKAIAGKKTPNGSELSGTWEEFCSMLGISVDKADMDITNLRAFGEEALESMSRMGIGYREMRQYRRLPDDQKAALIEVAQTGDKEAFVDLAEEIIAKHAKEKQELTQRLDDVNADYEAQSEVMAKKTDDLDKTRQELEKLRKRIQALPASEAVSELRLETTAVAFEAEAKIRGALREGFSKLAELGSAGGDDQRVFAAGLIRQLEITLAEVRSEFHLPAELDGTPAWMGQD